MHVAAAGKGLNIIDNFLNNIENCKGIHVDVLFPRAVILVGSEYGRVSRVQELGDVVALRVVGILWRVWGKPYVSSITVVNDDFVRLVVVVNFE